MNSQEPVWTTKEGLEIPYYELTDSHLKNIVRFVWQHWEAAMEFADICRGDMAVEGAEREAREIEDELDGLLHEVDRRGLSRTEVLGVRV